MVEVISIIWSDDESVEKCLTDITLDLELAEIFEN